MMVSESHDHYYGCTHHIYGILSGVNTDVVKRLGEITTLWCPSLPEKYPIVTVTAGLATYCQYQ